MADVREEILHEYDSVKGQYDVLGQKISDLLLELLGNDSIPISSVSFRVKGRDSLAKKITRKPQGHYENLADITDICGLRIVTYFEDDVARVDGLIRREFLVDEANFVNKSEDLGDNEFGYRSVHEIISLGVPRCDLPENKRIKGLKAEVQIRSILQHAWAEIEHDLGYKSKAAVPRLVRRRFFRLAGLLELADQEFMTIRGELEKYVDELPQEIVTKPADVTIDKLSLDVFIKQDSMLEAVDEEIVEIGKWELDKSTILYMVARLVAMLSLVGVVTIEQLSDGLRVNHDMMIEFAKKWINDGSSSSDSDYEDTSAPRGVAILYLCYVMMLSMNNRDVLVKFVAEHFDGDSGMVSRLEDTYRRLKRW